MTYTIAFHAKIHADRPGIHSAAFFRSSPLKRGSRAQCMAFYVYVLASERNGTLYVGMTDNLAKRIWQHRNKLMPGFTQRYGVKTLVWYESHESRESAFARVGSKNGTEPGNLH